MTSAASTPGTSGPERQELDMTVMPRVRLRDASDDYAMYCAGFYPTCNRKTDEFYWGRLDERYLVTLGAAASGKARKMLKKEVRLPFRCSFGACPRGVLDHLQDRRVKPRSWVNAQVRTVYERLIQSGHAFTLEAWHDEELAGGMIGIAVGRTAIIETIYGLPEPKVLRSASKALICHSVIEFERIGVKLIDVQNKHPENDPWARLGETAVTLADYRRLIARQQDAEIDVVTAMAGWNSPLQP